MALITKPDFTYVWASGGAVVAPNDAKKQLGWVAEAPPFQYDNWLQNRQDQMLAHINQRGMPAWDGTTNYEAASLSYVQGSDGKIYKSVAASGPLTTVQDPTTDVGDTYWTVAFADVGSFLTQVAGDARYAQLSNNLSDLTNAATARTNLGIVSGSETTAGLLELATNAETATGTDTTRAVHPAGLAARLTTLPFALQFGSAELTITAAGSLVVAHGLGVVPKIIQCELVCKTAELNYSVNDVLQAGLFDYGGSGSNSGASIVKDATNLNIRYGSTGVIIANKTTGVGTTITPANWRLVVRAFA